MNDTDIEPLLDTLSYGTRTPISVRKFKTGRIYKGKTMASEIRRVICSFLLFQLVEMFVMFTTTMSNETLNIEAPVLPDSILDLHPFYSVAALLSELLLLSYQIWLIAFLVLHKRRLVLARRCLAVLSICFMLRIICIWANVLPRSQYTMECAPKATGFQEVMKRVILLWSAAGLSIFGGHMCGNYFFSGHALMAVIIYYQLSHYMPSNWCIAHKINGLTALTISTLILLAHNHYTLDILGSVIVGSWVFKLYTFIAETKEIKSEEWFCVFWRPLVEFFEKDKEKVEYSFGGPRELLDYMKFAFYLFCNKQNPSKNSSED